MRISTKVAGLLLMLLCGSAQAEWVEYGSTKDGKVFSYNPARTVPLSDGKVKVWNKQEWNAKSKIADLEAGANEIEGTMPAVANLMRSKISLYKNYSNTLSRTIFDCQRQRYFDEETIDYSTDGRVLEIRNMNSLIAHAEAAGIKVNQERFAEVYPDTVIEALMNKVCK